MKGRIAVNPKSPGDQSKNNRGFAETFTSEQLDGLLSEDWLRKKVADIRGGNEKLKDTLPYISPHYSAFRNNHRAQADIIPEAFTFMTCVDVDDKELVDKAIQRAFELNEDHDGEWFDQVLRMEYSARKKVHIYIRIPKGMTIEEAQKAFCQELGVPYDVSCITPERFIYLTGKDEEIYRSVHWLEPIGEQELEERREAFLQRGMDVDGRPLKQNNSVGNQTANNALPLDKGKYGEAGKGSDVPQTTPLTSHGIPYTAATERTRYIFNACLRECELEPEVLIVEGARHEAVKSILSVGATQLLTQAEFYGVLSEMMPANWADKNIQDLVSDFYQKYTDPHQKMTQFQRRVFARSRKKADGSEKILNEKSELADTEISITTSSEPPKMPEKLPALIKLLTSNTPDIYKAAVAHAVFPPLGTHLCGVRFKYTDNVEHEATLMNCLMAGTGAGKGCIDEPIKHIMADVKHRDEENERREAEWKKDCQRKGANKDKMVRPEGLVIQIIDADMTKPALVTRMDEAEGHFVYVKLNELDLFEQLKGQTGKQHFQLMCLAFDPGAEYGQTRVGTQSVTARPECRFNWNACTTLQKGRRFFSRVLTDGPISRINFCTIPETEIGAEQPIYGQYDAAFDEALKPYIDNLLGARGLIDCQQAYKLAKKLQQECAEFARLSQSEVYWNLSHRACVIAWLKACVLYVANGQKWERSIEDFIRWSLNYDLWCKMSFFGNDIEKANNGDDARFGTRGPRNLLELLPDVFTVQDAIRVRRQEGKDAERTGNMISTWKKRHYVVQMADGSFQKSDMFKKNS